MRTHFILMAFTVACAAPPDTKRSSTSGVQDTGAGEGETLSCIDPVQYFYDADGDGFGDENLVVEACSPPVRHVTTPGDCDDIDPSVHPDAVETCNERDDNCDGVGDAALMQVFYADVDGDGFGDESAQVQACVVPDGHVENSADCDDTLASVNPDATESCNEVDDNCDDQVDEGVLLTLFADHDRDGFGDEGESREACSATEELVLDATDCDDTNASVNPAAIEMCNDIDDNCDGEMDEFLKTAFFTDSDSDGFGDPDTEVFACSVPSEMVSDGSDCDDADAWVNPEAVEVCNERDDDCDDEVDEGVLLTLFIDHDRDGFGDEGESMEACSATDEFVLDATDCDDTDASVNPAAMELCNDIDDNCDGEVDEFLKTAFFTDSDSDGFGDPDTEVFACSVPSEMVSDGSDCDDADAWVNPEAVEVCNERDDDCDDEVDEGLAVFTVYRDSDGDGFGDPTDSQEVCIDTVGWVSDATDCDDADPETFEGAMELLDGVDNDCSDRIDDLWVDEADSILSGSPSQVGFAYRLDAGQDLIGDGRSNFLVGGLAADSAYVFSADISEPIDSTLSAFQITGDDPAARLGSSLAMLTDFNADGFADVALGAPNAASDDAGSKGMVYILFGPLEAEDGTSPGSVSVDRADVQIRGSATDGTFALWLASAGTYAEGGEGLLVSTTGGASGLNTVALFQQPDEDSTVTEPDPSALTTSDGGKSVLWTSSIAGSQFGTAAVSVGDLDGDGLDEVLIGAPMGSEASPSAAYLYMGPALASLTESDADGTFFADESSNSLGTMVAGGGDVDGDGTSDFAIAAPDAPDDVGLVYVVLGGHAYSFTPISEAAFVVLSDETAGLGASLDMDGDVDGDGRMDLLAGAPDAETEWMYGGHAALFLGGMSGHVDIADATVSAAADYQYVGSAVAFVGGFADGTGPHDILVGAYGVDEESGGGSSEERTGAAYLFRSLY